MTLQEAFELNIFGIPPFRDLPYAKKEKIGAEISAEILERVAEEIVESLPEKKAEEFIALFSGQSSPEERAHFLNANIPDFEEGLVREILQYKEDFKQFTEERTKNVS